jgi:hypothetical protein
MGFRFQKRIRIFKGLTLNLIKSGTSWTVGGRGASVNLKRNSYGLALQAGVDVPLGLIAPCRVDHPLLAKLDPDIYARSTRDHTLLMLLNAGPFHREITRLSLERQTLLFGSSANLSLHGTKFRVEDMESEITAIADVVIDYGLMKYHPWQSSSTLIHCETLEVVRYGSCFENIADILKRHFRIELPPRPASA